MNTKNQKTLNINKILQRLEDKKILYIYDAHVWMYSTDDKDYISDKRFSSYYKANQYVVINFAHLVLSDNEKFADRYREGC